MDAQTLIALASLVFLPFLRRRWLRPDLVIKLMALGAIQLGIMYLFYYHSFLLLTVPEVLVFTIFTPIYVTLIHDLLEGRFKPTYLWGALLAVLGAAVIRFDGLTESYVMGFLVVQGANLCFALGQVGYKVLLAREAQQPPQLAVFGCFYLGALVIALPAWWLLGQPQYPTSGLQWGILLWLGVGASGLGYFLWNKGATLVSSGVLAIMNNALIPAGLLVNLVLWGKDTDLFRLSLGALLMLASLWVCQRQPARSTE